MAEFGVPPALLVRAPGRVNLIGEHTDYNDGFVLPLAIERAVWIALRPRADDAVRLRSLDFADTAVFNLAHFEPGSGWAEYVKGVAWALQDAGYALQGWEGVMAGDVPVGAGLSSSAALELAAARAFTAVAGLRWDPAAMARLSQRAENRWVGVNCGIMDQMISAAGQAGHALLIDCRTLDTAAVPLPAETAVVILDTATRRGLVDSAYNERRAQCEAAAAFFEVAALRDVTSAQFALRAAGLDAVTRRRARHVVTENERTLAAAAAMRQGDAARLGQLMNASHASLRDDFEVTNDALNQMVALAQRQPGCYGARMTGAGFGGCAVALVAADAADAFARTVAAAYAETAGLQPQVYVSAGAAGAGVCEP
ncbi:MAG: galactokinase [Anaerolineales bacterium]|nr:galactokinase [Anaerolineales bacterium]